MGFQGKNTRPRAWPGSKRTHTDAGTIRGRCKPTSFQSCIDFRMPGLDASVVGRSLTQEAMTKLERGKQKDAVDRDILCPTPASATSTVRAASCKSRATLSLPQQKRSGRIDFRVNWGFPCPRSLAPGRVLALAGTTRLLYSRAVHVVCSIARLPFYTEKKTHASAFL